MSPSSGEQEKMREGPNKILSDKATYLARYGPEYDN